jgi:hypothetical protein
MNQKISTFDLASTKDINVKQQTWYQKFVEFLQNIFSSNKDPEFSILTIGMIHFVSAH